MSFNLKRFSNRALLIAVGTGSGVFLTTAHVGSVIATLPVLSNSFAGGSATTGHSILTVYFLVLSALLLLFGRMSDARGARAIYLAGLCIFMVASTLCGLALSWRALMLFRACQGVGAAMLSATATAIVGKSLTAREKGGALGCQAGITYLGLIVGPILGGYLVSFLSWRFVFFVNVPIGLVALWIAYNCIPFDRGTGPPDRLRVWGAAISWSAALISVLLALEGREIWLWDPRLSWIALGLAVFCFWLFWRAENGAPKPLLPIELFRSCPFSCATLNEAIYYSCLYAAGFLAPLFLIRFRGLDPLRVGALFTMQAVARAATAPISGMFVDRVGTRAPVVLGISLLGAALFSLSNIDAKTSVIHLALSLIVLGSAAGVFVPANGAALLSSVGPEHTGSAVGLLSTARNVGMAIGTASAATAYSAAARAGLTASLHAIHIGFSTAGIVTLLMLFIPFVEHQLQRQLRTSLDCTRA
jgi:EmrB/QacA subfamily drug resistance transporter